ncbi:MAG: P-loop NTPase [Coriobacteriia bacterium]|jgi:MinD superfamily P-loop ATPase|nr:P-loop NTPase [Coriobacteriia bacterium]
MARRPAVIAIASGKGGTGKTLVATTIAAEAAASGLHTVLVDCDADAPNDHIFLPRAYETISRVRTPVASVDSPSCTACGECSGLCAYGAVRVLGRSALVFNELCHGCGLCADVCPENAITMQGLEVGSVIEGPTERTPDLRLVSGVLDVGQVKAPDVIRAAVEHGLGIESDLVVLDAPPGVACSVVAAVREADALLLVAEPTPFGLHDLGLAVELGNELRIPMAILANKVTPENEPVPAQLSRFEGVPVVHSLPFSRRTAERYASGDLPVDGGDMGRISMAPVLVWLGSLSAGVSPEAALPR